MAREQTIPSTSTFIQDFGLNVSPPPAARNRKVVVIGTAEDGPMYEPILIEKPEDAEFVWGRLGKGDLVRGIYECWDVQTGYPTVVGVRIGTGKTASLEIVESSGSGDDAPQSTPATAIKLEALYPGQIYNQITVGYNDNRDIAIYNPKTGQSTVISVDTEHPNNTNADIHNVGELVDVINSDRNLSSIMTASYTELNADFEVKVISSDAGVSKNDDTGVEISLEDVLPSVIETSGFMVTTAIRNDATSTNNLVTLDTVESVSFSQWELLEAKGKVTNQFALFPLDGKGNARWDTIQALKDYNSDSLYVSDPSGAVVSEYCYSLNKELMDDLPTESGGYWSGSTPTNTLKLTVPLCLDDSEESSNNRVASGYIVSNSDTGETYANYSSTWTNVTCQAIDTKEVDGEDVRPSGLIKVYVSDNEDINGYWQELTYNTSSGIYMSSYSAGVATFSIGASAKNNSKMRALIDADGVIVGDKFVRVTANTVKGKLSEVESLPQLEDAGSTTLSSYFVRGQEVLFNKAPEFNIVVNYGTRITYEVGANVDVSDINEGYVKFTDPELLPGPGGGKLDSSKYSYIRFNFTFMPNFPAITSSAKSLSGGTNGDVISNSDRFKELEKAYDKLRNYKANVWLPMSAYIDATAEKYNPVTGLKEVINVGYHSQLEDFLEDLSINSLQPHAVLGVTPMATTSQVVKDLWVEKLTVTDTTDPTRAANVMSLIQNKFISVVAFDPIFMNIGRGRSYTANGQAAYAGYLASLPYDISPLNKEIPGIGTLRYDLSIAQYEALNGMRYVVMKDRAGKNPVVVEDVTGAPYGSDFVNWSTFSITAEASDRVKSVAESFLGKPNSVELRNSMEQMISNALLSMSGLRAFDFSITSTPNQQVLGVIEIDLILVPVFTIKKIRTTVKLRKNLSTSR